MKSGFCHSSQMKAAKVGERLLFQQKRSQGVRCPLWIGRCGVGVRTKLGTVEVTIILSGWKLLLYPTYI